jgi:hypothetical protein
MSKSKKFAALIVILIAFSISALAQAEEEDGEHGLYLENPRAFFGGLVAGASRSQVDGDYFAGYHKFAFNGGGIVHTNLAKHLTLSMELLFAQKGSKSSGAQIARGTSVPVIIVKYGIKANYAEVPVMINYFDKRKSHFGLGVSYSRLVGTGESVTTDSMGIVKTIDLEAKYPFKKNDFNVVASANLHLIKGLYLNIRFQYSVSPIRSGKNLPPVQYARSDQYNNLWTIRLMYLVGK